MKTGRKSLWEWIEGQDYSTKLRWLLYAALFFLLIVYGAYAIVFHHEITTSHEKWGQFGDTSHSDPGYENRNLL